MFRFPQRSKQRKLLFLALRQPLLLIGLLSSMVFAFACITSSTEFLLAGLIVFAYMAFAVIILQVLPELIAVVRDRQWISVFLGMSLFALIVMPANAAIFDTAENYTTSIFGQYIDNAMIKLIFGFLRISAFIMGAAFVMLALEKARHGENWQPFAWNAFAVLMVVVLIEGMSSLFLSSTTATPTPTVSPAPTTR